MSARLSLVLILICHVLCGCAGTATRSAAHDAASVTYDWPALCPEGHCALRHVQIIYGLVFPTLELREHMACGEVRLGGCIRTRHSPHAVAVCRVCDYEFNPEREAWHRYSSDPTAFAEPLSQLITGFPLPPVPQETPAQYRRTAFADGRTHSEHVAYWTAEGEHEVKRRVEDYYVAQGLTPKSATRAERVPLWDPPPRVREVTEYTAEGPQGRVRADVVKDLRDARVRVNVDFELRE